MSYLWLLYIIPLVLFSLSIYYIQFYSKLLYNFQNVLQMRKAEIISYEYIKYKTYKTNIKIDDIDAIQTVDLDYLPTKGNKIDVYIDLNDLSNIVTTEESPNKSIFYIVLSVIFFIISCFMFYVISNLKVRQKIAPTTST